MQCFNTTMKKVESHEAARAEPPPLRSNIGSTANTAASAIQSRRTSPHQKLDTPSASAFLEAQTYGCAKKTGLRLIVGGVSDCFVCAADANAGASLKYGGE